MNKYEIEARLKQLRLEHTNITNKRKMAISDAEESELFFLHKEISNEISELEWQLKSSREKNDYRKSVLSMGDKWSNMNGARESISDTSTFSLIVVLCDTALDLLEKTDIDEGLKNKLSELILLLDSKKM